MLAFAAIGPLFIMLVYFLPHAGPVRQRGVDLLWDAWVGILYTRDIFDDTLKLADAHLTIFWRSVNLSILTHDLHLPGGLSDGLVHCHPFAPLARAVAVSHHHPVLDHLLIRTFAINEIIRNEGLLNTILLGMGFIDAPLNMIYTDTAVFIGMTYVYLPLMVLPLFAAIDRFDMRLLEAGYDLYASRWQVLRKIILPIVRPGIVAGSILGLHPGAGGLCHAPHPGRRART